MWGLKRREKLTASAMSRMYEAMSGRIRGGEVRPGARLPSERTLMEDYGINRMAVKAVMNQLVREHLVYRIQGKGTFVQDQERSSVVINVPGGEVWFWGGSEQIAVTVVGAGMVQAVGKLKRLVRGGEQQLMARERVFTIGDRPILLERFYFCGDDLSDVAVDYKKVGREYTLLYDSGAQLAMSNASIELIKADPAVAGHLMLTDEALVYNMALWFTDDGIMDLAYVEQYVRTDGVTLKFGKAR